MKTESERHEELNHMMKHPDKYDIKTGERIKTSKSKGKALSKMYTSPTGSKHRVGSQKHKYWEGIIKRGEDNRKAGVEND